MIQKNRKPRTFCTKFSIAYCLGLLTVLVGHAQTNSFTPTIVPQSPNAASLGKSGDVPVTLYTGQINPSIPIYEIKLSDFTFPISLSYSSSGLKTNETPSWVGMGWTLSATGVINRQLRGIPDEVEHGYQGFYQSATTVKSIIDGGYSPTSPYAGLTQAQFLYKIANGYEFDSEPDMFVLSCAGLSGKFFFDETAAGSLTNKTPVWIPLQKLDLKAALNHDGTNIYNAQNKKGVFTSFIVKDTRGVKYIFDISEGSFGNLDDDYAYGKNLANAWYLSKIETPNNNVIEFQYKTRLVDMPPTVSEKRYVPLYNDPAVVTYTGANPSPIYNQSRITEIILEKITVNGGLDGEIFFIEETNDRHDWPVGNKSKALSEIQVKLSGTLIQSHKFTYDTNIERLLLRSVQQKNGTSLIPPTTFQYKDEAAIPKLPSYSGGSYTLLPNEDHWGYYNQNSTGKLLPQLSVVNDPSGYTYFYFTAENRAPNFYNSSLGQLTQITYPTGGTTQFEWEAQSYVVDANKPDPYTACNNTLETIATATVTGDNTPHSSPITNSVPFSVILPNQCTEVNYQFKFKGNLDVITAEVRVMSGDRLLFADIKERNRPTDPATDPGEIFNYTRKLYLPKGDYTLVATIIAEGGIAFSSSNQAWIEFRQIQASSSGTNFVNRQGGGVRIKTVKSCPITAGSCIVKQYDYSSESDPLLSSGTIVSQPIYDNLVFVNAKLTISTDQCVLRVPYVQLLSSSQLPIATTLGNYIGYRNVKMTEFNEADNSTNGSIRYRYSSPVQWPDYIEGGESIFPYPPPASMDWRRGMVENQKVFHRLGTLKQQTATVYSAMPSNYYTKVIGIKFGQTLFIDCIVGGLGDVKEFKSVNYPIISGFIYPSLITDTLYQDNGKFTTTTANEFASASHLQITKSTLTNSKEEPVETQFSYPHDKASGGNVYQQMVAGNIISPIVEKRTSVNNVLQTTETTNYIIYNKPSSIVVTQNGGPAVTKITFNDYDSNGNLLSYTEQNGLTTAFTYYNTAGKKNQVATKTIYHQSSPTNNQQFSYDYYPLIGLKSQTDPNEKTTSYEYDIFNRLTRIKDYQNRLLKEFCYQYSGLPIECGLGTFTGIIPYPNRQLSIDLPGSIEFNNDLNDDFH